MVSDNNGSAFITKAEFEALKDDFNSQIDNYNKSISSKIDGAIANYLASIPLKETTYQQEEGAFSYPLYIYMNYNDLDDTGNFSKWEVTQNHKVMIGYYSAYITDWITKSSSWQPKQWYDLIEEDGVWWLNGGSKNKTCDTRYVVWGLSDTGLGNDSGSGAGLSGKPNHVYLYGATAQLGSSWTPVKHESSDIKYNVTPTGSYVYNTNSFNAPDINGITAVEGHASPTNGYIERLSTGQHKFHASAANWYSGWFGILFNSQSQASENNYINAITNTGSDYVHVSYDGNIKFSIRDDKLYGVGALGSFNSSDKKSLNQIRTSERNVSFSDRYVNACAMPYFAIIKENYNATTTNIDFSNWLNTSLVKAEHVKQLFKEKGANKTDLEMKISDGLYLCTVENDGSVKLKINVDYTSWGSTTKPYIIVNTNPIPDVSMPTNFVINGFKEIEGGTQVTLASDKYARYLDNGITEIKVNGCKKNEPLIIKILWDNTSVTTPLVLNDTVDIVLRPE